VDKNPQTKLNQTIQTEKWSSGQVAAGHRVVCHTFLGLGGLKWVDSIF
jgi:ABC-type transporter lipoprotein component MlaA